MNRKELEIGSHGRVRNGRGTKHVAVVVIFGVELPNYPRVSK